MDESVVVEGDADENADAEEVDEESTGDDTDC
jgi:hypothetical protein